VRSHRVEIDELSSDQDLLGWSVQINRPGQVGDSNWTYRLPLPIEKLRRSRAIQTEVATAREISRSGRSGIYDVRVTAGDLVIAEFRGHSRTIDGTWLPVADTEVK